MNNPRGGRDCDKEKELMGEAENMGRDKKREVYIYRVITSAIQRRILSLGKSFCTSCQTTLQEKLEQRQLWEGTHLDWNCIAIHNSKVLHISLFSGPWRWTRGISGFLNLPNVTSLNKSPFSDSHYLFGFFHFLIEDSLRNLGYKDRSVRTHLRAQIPITTTQCQKLEIAVRTPSVNNL